MTQFAARIASSLLAMLLIAAADEPKPLEEDTIHSDLPLFDDYDRMWPRAFRNADEFGCTSRVPSGDWALLAGGDEEVDASWLRIANYGVFHCAAVVSEADERAELEGSTARLSFFVELGRARTEAGERELWALQLGTRPGSDYLLLARSAGLTVIESFWVLQRACPRGRRRDAGAIDVFRTDYCAINSRADLTALARRMAKLPPLGRLELRPEPAGPASSATP